jgi:hypothetical protein
MSIFPLVVGGVFGASSVCISVGALGVAGPREVTLGVAVFEAVMLVSPAARPNQARSSWASLLSVCC